MKRQKDNDGYQWVAIMQHWGLLIWVVIMMLMMQGFMFFINLTGTLWMGFCIGSFALMLTGAVLLLQAKMPAYRSGRFFTFGIKSVPEHLVGRYRWGWRLFLAGMAVGFCLMLSRHHAA